MKKLASIPLTINYLLTLINNSYCYIFIADREQDQNYEPL